MGKKKTEVVSKEKIENAVTDIGIGGGVNPIGYPFNQGLPWTAPVQNSETLFVNLRWYLVSNNRQLLNEMYAELGLVQTIIDVPVDDGMRGGVTITTAQLNEKEVAKLLTRMDREDDLNIIAQAAKWNRLFGGGGVMILTDQDPAEPLDLESLSLDSDVEFRAVDMWELFFDVMNVESYQPSLDGDEFTHFSYYGMTVHKSRVLRLEGIEAPSFIRPKLRGWGLSVIEILVRSINQYLKGTDLAFEVLDEFKVDYYKIKGLVQSLMSPNGKEKVQRRIAEMNLSKNFQNAIVMDSEDEWDHKQLSFQGLADAMLQIRIQVASDMRIPMTKLFGLSASGFNSGEDDIEVYNAMVESQVRNKIKFIILRAVEIRCQELFGFIPDDLEIGFESLRVMSSEQEENVKDKKFSRALQSLQTGAISLKEFRDICNKSKLFELPLETTDESDLSGFMDMQAGDKGEDPYSKEADSSGGANNPDSDLDPAVTNSIKLMPKGKGIK